MSLYDCNLEGVTPEAQPDRYSPESGRIPPDDFVVSRTKRGDVASRYGEHNWDFSAYHPEQRAFFIHFFCWGGRNVQRHTTVAADTRQLNLMAEAKWLVFLMLYVRPGHRLAVRTIRQIMVGIRHMQRYCYTKHLTMAELLTSSRLLIDCFAEGQSKVRDLGGFLRTLHALGPTVVGFDVAGLDAQAALTELRLELEANYKQNAPMPTRIYSELISRMAQELDEVETVLDPLLSLVGFALNKENAALDLAPKIAELGLAAFFEKREKAPSRHKLSGVISEILCLCGLQVQCFSGMRHSEVNGLPFNCLTSEQRHGTRHWIITGYSTKFNRGRKKLSRWVTCESGARAIRVAQRIAKAMLSGQGLPEEASSFLFVNTLLGDITTQGEAPNALVLSAYPALAAWLTPIITPEDVAELEQIDPHRAWLTEAEYEVGAPWPLKSHQFRRSLALYAQRSGLVSLPSLKRQLQHLTAEMAQYYAKGSAFANDFIGGEKTHFGHEWRDTQPESQFLSYVANVLLADDVLLGGHSNWVARRLKQDGTVLLNRAETLSRFEKGQMAFKESPIGGCVNTGQCDSGVLDLFDTACLEKGCKNQVVSLKKLGRVIVLQQKHVAQLKAMPPSIELAMEQHTLDVLLNAQQRAEALERM